MRVLVAEDNGFIGTRLVERLPEGGHAVRISGYSTNRSLGQ